MAVIQIYAPTTDSSDDVLDEFYNTLESILSEIPKKDVNIIMGDWNAKVRSENEGQESVTGCYWYDTINERGEKLIDFAGKHNFFMTNTRFEQKATRKWIWLSLDGLHCNMIDLILIDKR